jgi:hypothetical protein
MAVRRSLAARRRWRAEARALVDGYVVILSVGPRRGCGQAFAAVQRAGVAALAVPGQRGVGRLLADQQPGAVLAKPTLQPGPGAQQRLMGQFHRVGVQRDQAGLRQGVHHDLGVARAQLVAGHPPLGVLGPLTQGHQAQQHRAD